MNHESNFDDTRGTAGPGNPPIKPLSMGSGRTRVKLELKYQGRDQLLLITGGRVRVWAAELAKTASATEPGCSIAC